MVATVCNICNAGRRAGPTASYSEKAKLVEFVSFRCSPRSADTCCSSTTSRRNVGVANRDKWPYADRDRGGMRGLGCAARRTDGATRGGRGASSPGGFGRWRWFSLVRSPACRNQSQQIEPASQAIWFSCGDLSTQHATNCAQHWHDGSVRYNRVRRGIICIPRQNSLANLLYRGLLVHIHMAN